jgi:photosystem II stability/assembly factor-like uncharacterized protein
VSDFERLTTKLRSDVSRAPWPEPDTIRTRGDRRGARRAVAGASLAVVVVLAAVVVAVSLGRSRDAAITPIGTPSGTVVPTSPAPSSSPPVPVTQAARDVSFVSRDVGWLLTNSPSMMDTIDGGKTWTKLPPLPADVPADGTRIRFADATTGYLYGPSVLYLTTDGGKNWTRQPGGAFALDLADGTALRVSSTSPGCPPGCQFDISSAPIGTANWHTVKADLGYWVAADLARSGRRAVAALTANFAGGGEHHGGLVTSADDGRTWTTRGDPCGTGDYAIGQVRMAPDGSTSVLCEEVTASAPPRVITSTDGGVTFGPPNDVPPDTMTLGASSASTLFACTLEGRTLKLYRSDDGGATWAVAATAPDTVPDGALGPTRILFPHDQANGWWLPGYATVFSTTDSGLTWTPVTVG